MIDYRLETFLSVCDTMNYHKSAELLHITQPAVTQHVHYLEQIYDCKLFRYENRRLKKTQSAAILEQYARTQKLSEENMLRQIHSRKICKLSIGATKTIGTCVISPYVERFIRIDDNELKLLVDNTEHLLKLIDSGQLDFALIEGHFDKKRYSYQLMSREPFVGICAKDHPFAGRKVSVEEILKETAIIREEGSGTRAILENRMMEFNESISNFHRTIVISSFPLILDYVQKGIGVSFVYEVLAKNADLGIFTIENGKMEREFNFVFRKNSGIEEKIHRFVSG